VRYLQRVQSFRPVDVADEDPHVRPDCPSLIPGEVQCGSLTDAHGLHFRRASTLGAFLLIGFQRAGISRLRDEEERDDEHSSGQSSTQDVPVARSDSTCDWRSEQPKESAHDGLTCDLPHEESASLVDEVNFLDPAKIVSTWVLIPSGPAYQKPMLASERARNRCRSLVG
jgi:hypothetical protein